MHKQKTILLLLLLLALLSIHVHSALAAPADIILAFDQEDAWSDTACQFMTDGGCAYFRAYEAEPAWLALKEMNAERVQIRFMDIAADFGSDLKLWRLELTVSNTDGKSETHSAFATALHTEESVLLDRFIVLDQTLLVTE